MALRRSAKRRYNVRSNSSCSSAESVENSVETGYCSDNSSENEFHEVILDSDETNFKMPGIVRKEFVLACDGGGKKKKKIEVENTVRSIRQPKCFSKNAINARLNRIKKKQQMEEMEKKLAIISQENSKLKEAEEKKDTIIKKLDTEVQYLRSVLANSKEIGVLLRCIKTSGLPVASSLFETPANSVSPRKEPSNENNFFSSLSPLKESNNVDSQDPFLPCNDPALLPYELFEQNDQCDSLQPLLDFDLPPAGGICLHVAQKNISVEFCAHCNANALAAIEEETVRT